MAEKKITKKDCIKMLLEMREVKANKDCIAYLENELELLSNRKSNGKKAKEKVEEQEKLIAEMATFLNSDTNKEYTATEIMRGTFPNAEVSVQKVTALLKKMIEAGTVEKRTEKKVTYFKAAVVAE